LDEGGATEHARLVTSDGPLDPAALPAGWTYDIRSEGGQGSRFVFWNALRRAAATDADLLLYFEDDVLPCRNAIKRALAVGVQTGFAFLSLFDMGECQPNFADGLYSAPVLGGNGQGFRGSQALVLPQRTIRMLASQDPFMIPQDVLTGRNTCDKAIAYFLVQFGDPDLQRYLIHMPSLVEHIGVESAAGHGDLRSRYSPLSRAATRWPGKDFDALALSRPVLRAIDLDPGAESQTRRFDDHGIPIRYQGVVRDPETRASFLRIEADFVSGSTVDIEERVIDFRGRTSSGAWATERGWLALRLARLYTDAKRFDEARTWALRALADGPRVDAFCLLGEIADQEGYTREALGWYEGACGMIDLPSWRATPGAPPDRYKFVDLTAGRESRREAIRNQFFDVLGLSPRPVRRGDLGPAVLALMTAPRRESLLEGTLRSLAGAGLERWKGPRLVVADGYAPAIPGWRVETSQETQGSMRTLLRLLRIVAHEYPGYALVSFQDDVVLARNALDYIATVVLDSDLALITWFNINDLPLPGPRLLVRETVRFDCGQGMTVPASTIATVLASDVGDTWPRRHGCDKLFGAVMPKSLYGIHVPDIVQHVGGLNSAMGNEFLGARMSPTFIGEDTDALNLTP
jgi:hypothetical protein